MDASSWVKILLFFHRTEASYLAVLNRDVEAANDAALLAHACMEWLTPYTCIHGWLLVKLLLVQIYLQSSQNSSDKNSCQVLCQLYRIYHELSRDSYAFISKL